MASKKRPKMGYCVYCGKFEPITLDHIPPKCLFPKDKRDNLIKVPSCSRCHSENKQVSQDDEYFRLKVVMRKGASAHPAAQEPLLAALRSLTRPASAGLRASVLNGLRVGEARSPFGIYLGRVYGFESDPSRLARVITRVTKGLFFHELGFRLPDDCEVSVQDDSRWINLPDDDELITHVIRPVLLADYHVFGDGVFTFRFRHVDSEPWLSAWIFTFYQCTAFLSVTHSKEPGAPET